MRPYPSGFHKQLDRYTSVCRECRSTRKRPQVTPPAPLDEQKHPVRYPGIAAADLHGKTPHAVVKDSTDDKIFILTDLHIPEHDPLFWSCVLAIAEREQPNEIILNGDIGELLSVNAHGGSPETMLQHEAHVVIKRLKELMAAAPNAKVTYNEGNHETRLIRDLAKNAPNYVGTLSIPSLFKLDELGITYVPEAQQPIARGNLLILHGHQLGSGKGKMLPRHHAMRATDRYGAPGRVIVYGHVHKEQIYSKEMYGGAARAIALGCGRTLNPSWTGGEVTGWIHQCAMAYVRQDTGEASVYPITVKNGVTTFNGTTYVGQKRTR